MKYALATLVYVTLPSLAFAQQACVNAAAPAGNSQPGCPVNTTPGPLLGETGNVWLLLAGLALFATYRLYKRAH